VGLGRTRLVTAWELNLALAELEWNKASSAWTSCFVPNITFGDKNKKMTGIYMLVTRPVTVLNTFFFFFFLVVIISRPFRFYFWISHNFLSLPLSLSLSLSLSVASFRIVYRIFLFSSTFTRPVYYPYSHSFRYKSQQSDWHNSNSEWHLVIVWIGWDHVSELLPPSNTWAWRTMVE
jgi:hypothetical protein